MYTLTFFVTILKIVPDITSLSFSCHSEHELMQLKQVSKGVLVQILIPSDRSYISVRSLKLLLQHFLCQAFVVLSQLLWVSSIVLVALAQYIFVLVYIAAVTRHTSQHQRACRSAHPLWPHLWLAKSQLQWQSAVDSAIITR